MLREAEASVRRRAVAIALVGLVGAFAALLVAAGNPGNMGLCGACFLRDLSGALGFTASGKAPAVFRPELAGVVLGSTALAFARRRFVARSGSYAAARFFLGTIMACAALVLLGCPFRLLQRLGGGDLNAWVALPGFVVGVLVATRFENRGYRIGRTAEAPASVGILGPLVFAGLLAAFLADALRGGGPGASGPPPRADWRSALGLALGAGAILSATGFCAIASVRSAFGPRRAPTYAALALVAGYAVAAAATGAAKWSFEGQPVAHGDAAWNLAAAFLLGLTGALAGGCPVRQIVLTGEGNGDAFTTVAGLVVGGAIAHNFGWVSTAASPAGPGGATEGGKAAIVVGVVLALAFAVATTRAHRRAEDRGAARVP